MRLTDIKATLETLLSVADELDKLGMRKYAEDIDQFAQEMTSQQQLNPKYEGVFAAVQDVIRGLGLDSETTSTVLSAIEGLQRSQYMVPAGEYYVPEGTQGYFVPSEAKETAFEYAQLFDALHEIEDEMEEAMNVGDDEKYKYLQNDYESDRRALQEKWQQLMHYKKTDPSLFDKLTAYIKYALSKEGPEVRLFDERRNKERRGNE